MSLHDNKWVPLWLQIDYTNGKSREIPLWLVLLLVAASGSGLVCGACWLINHCRA